MKKSLDQRLIIEGIKAESLAHVLNFSIFI